MFNPAELKSDFKDLMGLRSRGQNVGEAGYRFDAEFVTQGIEYWMAIELNRTDWFMGGAVKSVKVVSVLVMLGDLKGHFRYVDGLGFQWANAGVDPEDFVPANPNTFVYEGVVGNPKQAMFVGAILESFSTNIEELKGWIN